MQSIKSGIVNRYLLEKIEFDIGLKDGQDLDILNDCCQDFLSFFSAIKTFCYITKSKFTHLVNLVCMLETNAELAIYLFNCMKGSVLYYML